MEQKRNLTLDIAKAICIMLMVAAFALVTYIYKSLVGEPVENLMNQCKGAYGLMWIVYTLVGITLPVLIWEVRHKASSGIIRRQETGYKRQGGK